MHLETPHVHYTDHAAQVRTEGRDTQQEKRIFLKGYNIPFEHKKHMLLGKND